MPVCHDQRRASLVRDMAKREHIHAVEMVLERAVSRKDSETIKIATSLLKDCLTEPKVRGDFRHATDIHEALARGYDGITFPLDTSRKSKTRDAFYSSKRGESMRPVECKPEDCPSCFWLRWCEAKEHFDFSFKINEALDLGKKLVAESRDHWKLKGSIDEARQKAETGPTTSQLMTETKATIVEHKILRGKLLTPEDTKFIHGYVRAHRRLNSKRNN